MRSADTWLSDALHAWRTIRARPAATIGVVLVLALGIGLTTAVFALADPFLLRPLPYSRPAELVVIQLTPKRQSTGGRIPTLKDWQSRADLFQGLAAYRLGPIVRLRTPAGGAALQTVEISANLPAVLGVSLSSTEPLEPAGARDELRVLVTDKAHERLVGDRAAVGATFPRQGGGTLRVVARLPPGFVFPRAADSPSLDGATATADAPLVSLDVGTGGQSFASESFTVIARLRDGVTGDAVRTALGSSLDESSGLELSIEPLTHYMRRGFESLALTALATGVLVLLTCAANVGNLLLAQCLYRAREFATREALGATGRDIARLTLLELGYIAAASLGCGLILAHIALNGAAAVIPAEYAALGTPALTTRAVAFSGLAVTVVLVAAVLLMWSVRQVRVSALTDHSVAAGPRVVPVLRFALGVGQMACAVVLLSGAALLVRSYANLTGQDTGFAPDVYVISVSYPPERTGALLQESIDGTLDRLRRVPGIAAVGAAAGPMVDRIRATQILRVNGQPDMVERKFVTPDYLQTVGTPIVSGRGLLAADANVGAVVNESFARRHWPGTAAVGQQVVLGMRPVEVVGVVRDTFDVALDMPSMPTVFTVLQNPASAVRVSYALRLRPRAVFPAAAVARDVAAVDRDAVIADVGTLADRLAASVGNRSFATLVLSFFAVAGLGVSAAGLIGIVSFMVARRTREIGIRVALGATRSRICRLVVREAVAAAGAGALIGLIVGRWLSTALEGQLYGIRAGDWPTLLIVSAIIVLMVALVALIPALRALRLSPSIVLRRE